MHHGASRGNPRHGAPLGCGAALEGSGNDAGPGNPGRGVRPRAWLGAAAGAVLELAARLAAQGVAGDLDPAFGAGGQVLADFQHSTDIAYAAALQADGRLVVVGTTYTDNDYSKEDFAVARLLPDGTLDPSFGTGGRVTTDFPGLAAVASSVVIQPDGKIVVAGGAFPLFTFLGDFKLVRYHADGSLDQSFGAGGIVTTVFPGQGSFADAVALQPDGRIVAAGTDFVAFSTSQSSDTDFALARYHANGTPDLAFGVNGQVTTDFDGGNDDAFSVLVQPDGRLIAVGSAVTLANFSDFAAARYLATGAPDPSFGVGGKVRTDFGTGGFDQARSAALQPDGKIVAAGFTIFDNGLSQPFALLRYGSNGALDTSFDGDGKQQIFFGSFNQAAHKVLLQPDGRIVAVGYANTESSDSDFLLARTNPDGSLDTSFGSGGKVRTSFGDLNGGAQGAALQPDGRIVAVGFQATFTSVGAEFALARYLGSPQPFALAKAVSRKSHPAAGTFDVPLPLAGAPGVECRSGNGKLSLVCTFLGNVAGGTASVTAGNGSVSGAPVLAGNTLTVNLTSVTDVQQLTVTLSGVSNGAGALLPDTALSVNLLIGDVSGDKTVNGSDAALTVAQLGQPVTAANFRADVNADGAINASDLRLVRVSFGHSLP